MAPALREASNPGSSGSRGPVDYLVHIGAFDPAGRRNGRFAAREGSGGESIIRTFSKKLVAEEGLEPPTRGL